MYFDQHPASPILPMRDVRDFAGVIASFDDAPDVATIARNGDGRARGL